MFMRLVDVCNSHAACVAPLWLAQGETPAPGRPKRVARRDGSKKRRSRFAALFQFPQMRLSVLC